VAAGEESEGLLERLSHDILRGKRILLGSAPGAVRVAASKLRWRGRWPTAGCRPPPPTGRTPLLPDGEGAWVVKPDDGAGCLDTRLFSDRAAALAWIRTSGGRGYVLQPFVAGKLGSLSLLCCDGAARLLARNLERVAVRDNRFHFLGSTVNGLDDADGALERLAQQVAAAMPTLWGYVGVDIILTARRRGTRRQSAPHRRLCRPARLDRLQPGRPGHRFAEGPAAMPAPVSARRVWSASTSARDN
jgi:predicted ATP-grasp superfamily ATP-dependent carboligase